MYSRVCETYSETSDKGPSEKRTASLERTVHNVPTFLDLREKDNLSIVDEMAGPFIRRFHCIRRSKNSMMIWDVINSSASSRRVRFHCMLPWFHFMWLHYTSNLRQD